ncbi:MAG: pirin family protein [Candidatus Kapabacteria bacterium]|nr:pirin family protein [Candidatus Kapabacteria bacterium]MDW8226034.1 pirin family protein [Bacteroidota bacterium]
MIRRVIPLQRREGMGAEVRRLFPTQQQSVADPFVLFDEFHVIPPAYFPDHSHKGFEAVTYLLEGGFRHRDNLNNDSTVMAGGAQRFTAGSGIVHAEYPVGKRVRGLQLWIVLPQALKGIEPSYQAVPQLMWEELGGVRRCWIVGGTSPIQLRTSAQYVDVYLPPGAEYLHPLPLGWQGFVYALEGGVQLNSIPIQVGEGLLFRDETQLQCAAADGARLILAAGEPWKEPIRLYGTFVL